MKSSARRIFSIVIAVLFFCLFAFSAYAAAFHECSGIGCCTVCKMLDAVRFAMKLTAAAAFFVYFTKCAKRRQARTRVRFSPEKMSVKFSE